MRKTNSKFLICLATTATALCALLNSVQAQPITPLVGFTEQSWQYYEAGNQPPNNSGVDWKQPTYIDSAWSTGFGFFAYEPDTPQNYDPINTFLTRSNIGATEITRTFYFRTHFSFPTNPANAILYFTNVVDDGAVIYLNGFEIYRYRVNGTPTYTTLASGGPPNEGLREVTTLFNSPRLRQGDNVIAVEVKQNDVGSSDIAWNLGVGYSFPDLINIAQHPPAKVAAVEGDRIVLSVVATGTDPRYWWFRNNVFLNQTGPTFTIAGATASSAATYHVVVSNTVSGARSSNTVITVVPDTFGPRILDAYVQIGDTNRLTLQFNETINSLATVPIYSGANTNNYFITLLGRTTQPLVVTQALVGGGGVVRLLMNTNFNPNTNYSICISNITDNRFQTGRTNIIAWNSCVPIGFEGVTNPIPYKSFWFYHEWGFSPEGDWKSLNYVEDPLRWIEQPGCFHGSFADTNHAVCSPLGWTMSVGYGGYYFRKEFVLATNFVGLPVDMTLGFAVDDGAVFYLNGTELIRTNVPPGEPAYGTRALSVMNNDCKTFPTFQNIVFPRTNNILAVALHQFDPGSVNDLDSGFDASLSFRYVLYPRLTQPTNIRVFSTNFSPTQVGIYFTNGFGWTLQSVTNLGDPWREVQPATNRLIRPKANPRQFFRLEKAH